MLTRVASRVSLRSRERKLRLFLELYHPGPETTVVDVGVTDAAFGGGSTDNFFEALYPWPERITAVGDTELERFAAAFPLVTAVRPTAAAAVRGRRVRPRLLERRRRARRPAGGRAAAVRRTSSAGSRSACSSRRRTAGSRSSRTRCCRSPTGSRGPRRDRLFRARGFDDVLDPLGPRELASLFPYPVRIVSRGHDARRRRARCEHGVSVETQPGLGAPRPRRGARAPQLRHGPALAAGVRGNALDVVSAWKDVLRARRARARDPRARRGCRSRRRRRTGSRSPSARSSSSTRCFRRVARRRGNAPRACSTAVRHDLLPVAAYFLGRGLDLTSAERAARLPGPVPRPPASPLWGWSTSTRPAPVVASLGRAGGSPISSGFDVQRAVRTARELRLQQGGGAASAARVDLPLAARDAYLLVVALLFVPLRGRRWGWPLALLLFAALLWTHTRAALLALVLALLVLAALRRSAFSSAWPLPWRRSASSSCRRTTTSGHARTSRRPSSSIRSSTRIRRRSRATTQRVRTRHRPASTCRASGPVPAPRCTIRGDSDSAMRE